MSLQAATSTSSRAMPRVELFKLFAEPGRLQVLALCSEEELSVSELATLLDDSQPQVSRKVAPLRDVGLLEARRDGTRTFLRAGDVLNDLVVQDAVAEGRRLCLADGSLSRMPGVIAAREARGVEHFDVAPNTERASSTPTMPEHLAHLAALAPLMPGRQLAIDVGTGDGLVLDVLAPLYQRIIAVDRSRAQLARVAQRVEARGFHHVSLFEGSYDDTALVERIDAAGGADLVFAGRSLHHASRPASAVRSLARLLKRGGHLVVLDYLPHELDSMREQGDVWLGFPDAEVRRLLLEAQLAVLASFPIPAAFHPDGPDASLTWHAWVAQRPT